MEIDVTIDDDESEKKETFERPSFCEVGDFLV
jgi:hypothetical protein